MDKLDKLKKLLELSQNDTLTPSEVKKFLEFVLQFISKSKSEFQNLSAENLSKINQALIRIDKQNEETLKIVSQETTKLKAETITKFSAKVKEIQSLMKAVEKMKPKDGKDADETKIVEDVLVKIPKKTGGGRGNK